MNRRRKVKQHLHSGKRHVSDYRIHEWSKFLSSIESGGPIIVRTPKQMAYVFGLPDSVNKDA